jgi:hypothetical protein
MLLLFLYLEVLFLNSPLLFENVKEDQIKRYAVIRLALLKKRCLTPALYTSERADKRNPAPSPGGSNMDGVPYEGQVVMMRHSKTEQP